MEPKEQPQMEQQLTSSKLLIKQILENDGLTPEEIEAVLRVIPDKSRNKNSVPAPNKNDPVEVQVVPENKSQPIFEEHKIERPDNLEDLPEDLKEAIAGLSLDEQQEIIRQYKEELESTRYINSLMENEKEENIKVEKADMDYILKYMSAEDRKQAENDDYINELMAKELQDKEKWEQEENKESEEYIKKLLSEEQKEKEEEDDQPAPQCAICLDDLFSQAVFPLYNCGHLYHIECLESYVIEEIKKRVFPIRCPHPDCKKEIPEDDIKDTLQGHIQYQDIYDEYYIKSYVESNPNDFLHCPTPNCKFVCCMVDGPRFDCPECKKNHCMKCETEWHHNLTCEAYQKQKKDQRDDVFVQFAERMHYTRCPKCRVFVERIEGCNAMNCSRCHTMFCYECGREGDGHLCNHQGGRLPMNDDGIVPNPRPIVRPNPRPNPRPIPRPMPKPRYMGGKMVQVPRVLANKKNK